MCTVTFLPGKGNEFILTSNRDEHTLRLKAQPPQLYRINNLDVIYPRDGEAGGSWIGASKHFTLCLLNGAFQKHTRLPPYAKSRGVMLLDFFNFNDVKKFANEYNFKGIEPFTLLLLDAISKLELYELRWDGSHTHLIKSDPAIPHIWSSVTLYEKEIIELRRQWFKAWLNQHESGSMEAIMHFHEFGGTGDKTTDVLMNRNNELLTVSITSISKSTDALLLKYKDVEADKIYTMEMAI